MVIKDNGTVYIRDLDNAACKAIIENIHNRVNFGRKLYCNGIIPLTPVKENSQKSSSDAASSEGSGPAPPAGAAATGSGPPPPPPGDTTLPSGLSPICSTQSDGPPDIGQMSTIAETPDSNIQLCDSDLDRRNTLSLRSPPLASFLS